jgi:transcriptional regulator GlxA family with amidase domain
VSPHRTFPKVPGFRLGIYVFKDAEIVDFAAPYGVFSVARRFDPELDAFLIADAMRPVQAQGGFTVVPNYSFLDQPDMDAFLIPGGFGTRQETHNGRLHGFIRALPEKTLITSVCTGSWIYGAMGLLDGKAATNRKEPDRLEASNFGKVPIDRLAEIAPHARISRARVVDAGRIVTAGGIASGMEMGFHLLRRAGYDENFIAEVARVMEYADAYPSTATISNIRTSRRLRRGSRWRAHTSRRSPRGSPSASHGGPWRKSG